MSPRRFRMCSRAFAAAVAGVALGGCAHESPPPVSAGPAHTPDVWESLFLPPDTEAALPYAAAYGLPGEGRNDTRLSIVDPGALTASGDWPEPDRASIEWTRYVSLPREARTLLFYLPQRPAPRSWPYRAW